MTQFVHPSKEDIALAGLMNALADPVRLCIFKSLMNKKGCMSCSEASAAHKNMAKSTLSHHFRIMRESGLIRTTKQGVEHRNVIRKDEINDKFPGLLKTMLQLVNE